MKPEETIKDSATGVIFPLQEQFWHGGQLRCLGAGPRVRKLGFIPVKVYSVAQYVDPAAAAEACQRAQQPDQQAAAADALKDGPFFKALQMRLVRGVSGKQFSDALDESLRPLMKGAEGALDQFSSFLHGKHLGTGTEVTLLRRPEGALDVCLRPPGAATPYAATKPGLSIESPRLGQALWELYLSPKSPAPEARNAWLAALPALPEQ